jgi:hypothetical protein
VVEHAVGAVLGVVNDTDCDCDGDGDSDSDSDSDGETTTDGFLATVSADR